MTRYAPEGMELAPRDVVSRAIFQEMAATGELCMHLDLEPLKAKLDLEERFPTVLASCRAAGLDNLLFPELVESQILLTNGRGVFSASLGEFVLAAILYFAKDFRRMVRNQTASVWEQFDVQEIAGQTVGILGYGGMFPDRPIR